MVIKFNRERNDGVSKNVGPPYNVIQGEKNQLPVNTFLSTLSLGLTDSVKVRLVKIFSSRPPLTSRPLTKEILIGTEGREGLRIIVSNFNQLY